VKLFAMRECIVWGAVIALAGCVSACQKDSGSSSGRGGAGRARSSLVFPVEIEVVAARPIVFSVNAVGSVEAFEKVQVTSRVAGVVDRVLFSEGSYAEAGQVLVEIETERYRLAVEAAQAANEKAEAAKADAEAGLKRRESVVSQTPGLIPAEEIETWRTKLRVAVSEVAQARAALNQAELNLHDAYVRAPISGIIQTRTVQTGQYVQIGTVLATLVRRDPLILRFQVSERDAVRIKPGMKAVFKVRDDDREFQAKIVHVAAAAEESTRLVEVTGEVRDTKDKALRPGSFAEISVPVGSEGTHPVIPQTAVRPSERGFIAYVVEGGKALERLVTIGMRTSEGQVEILSGLSPGDTLVVRGGEALREGVPVKITAPGGKAGPTGAGGQVQSSGAGGQTESSAPPQGAAK
jgi:multidrug efflux system membrane fusion protein